MLQRRGGYEGPITVVGADGTEFEADAVLVGFVDRLPLLGPALDAYMDGAKSWNGTIETTEPESLAALRNTRVRLRTPDGREGVATVLDETGTVKGAGPPPFDF
ncbi:hypothetical protein BH18ACT4_BH18ACT4_02830 [soil metagenome]